MCSKAQHGFIAIGRRLAWELQKITLFPYVCKLALPCSAVLTAFLTPSQASHSSQQHCRHQPHTLSLTRVFVSQSFP